MSNLIDRQAAIRKYQEVCNGIKCGECPFLIKVNTEKGSHLITDCKLEAFLYDLPSAQPEIIRCKNCIHNNDCDIQYSAQAGENFFCGFGETEKDIREDVYE